MKIAFIGQKGIPAKGGGVENYVDNLASRLSRKGYHILAYTRKHYAPVGEYKGIQVIATSGILSKNLEAITYTFTAIIHSWSISDLDVLHINSVGPALLTPLARFGFFVRRIFTGHRTKIVFTFHSADWHHGKWSLFAKWMLLFGAQMGCWFADEVVTVSKSLRDVAKKEFGTDATYIPNGTSLHNINSEAELEQFGLTKGKYIVFIARLVPHKNAHVLIEAFQRMKKRHGWQLVIVGGSANTDNYVTRLEHMTAEDPDIIMTGHQTGRTLKQLFAHAGCYVLPSSSEGLSISLLEAGSYALPVVISNIRENKEIVGRNGYVARVGSSLSLSRALQHVLDNPREAKERGEALQEEIKGHYSWSNIVKAFEKVYERDSEDLRGTPVRVSPVFQYK